jgi:hypothetical protein
VRKEPWPADALCRPALRPSSTLNTYVHPGVGCSSRIIQLTPNRSLTCSRADAAERLSDYPLHVRLHLTFRVCSSRCAARMRCIATSAETNFFDFGMNFFR